MIRSGADRWLIIEEGLHALGLPSMTSIDIDHLLDDEVEDERA